MLRRKIEVNRVLDEHILGYERAGRGSVLSASALAAVLAAATSITQAEVVFTPTHEIVSVQNGAAQIDFNGDGIVDATIYAGSFKFPPGQIRPDSCSSSCSCGSQLFLKAKLPTNLNGVAVTGRKLAARGRAGQIAGPADSFKAQAEMAVASHFGRCRDSTFGPWKDRPAEGFLGIQFQIDGATHYGWIRLRNTSQRGGLITGYAYETIPNKPITAGSTDGSEPLSESTELPSRSLGKLAAGVTGR